MLRRILNLMLVLALLTNQVAVGCAHSHLGGTTGSHSARPHLHLSGDSFWSHPHSHEHHSGHKHQSGQEHSHAGHEHVSPGTALPDEGPKTDLDLVTTMPVDHDSDAVYFVDDIIFITEVNHSGDKNVASATLYFDLAVPRVSNLHCRIPVSRAGPFMPYCGTIFLQTRRLLL